MTFKSPTDVLVAPVTGADSHVLGGRTTMFLRTTWTAKVGLGTAAALLALAVMALVGEAVMRDRERHRTSLAGTMPTLFYQHGRLGHALVRDFDYFGRIHINRNGFRGAETSAAKAPGIVRLMVVGSSTTFDPAVSGDQATWPARLQFWLTQLAPNHPVEVINAGVPGYRVVDNVIRLETELFRYQPDVVVLYEGHNDLFAALRGGHEPAGRATHTPGELPVVTPWGRWLSRHSLLYGKLVARLETLRFMSAGRRALATAPTAGSSDEAMLDAGAHQFAQDLTAFLAVARGVGTRVVIPEMVHVSGVGTLDERDSTLLHVWSYTVPFASPETVLRGYVRYNAVLQEIAGHFGATWVPTHSFGLAGPAWFETGDPIHFNDRGADRMARGMADALVAAGVLDAH